ncbi:MAG: acyltransferase [Actinomycetota bacterium]|nr:acyltransferase [Actinomycetota bacterium]
MPRPNEQGRRYVAGLDGIRAVAVACVIAYHLGAHSAPGGMLGVGIFFTLSGYLITDLLLEHYRRRGNFGLGEFWVRRARRLLPALFLMLAVVSLWVALFDASQLAAVRTQVIAASVYVSNWVTIAQHGSYFARFANPLPLDHLWSLAIEEQFYLVWPWLLGLGMWAARSRKMLAVLTLIGVLISAVLMAHFYSAGYDPTRAYEGTDTRAFALLIGAALAILWPSSEASRGIRPAAPGVLDALGLAGLIGAIVLVWKTSSFSSFLYPYGFLLLSLCTAAMIAAVANPSSLLGSVLGCRPLRWIGVRSYGIYLWQWPIIVLASPTQGTISLPTAALEVGATVLVAAVSWRYVEDPIRRGGLAAISRRVSHRAKRLQVRRKTLTVSSVTLGVILPVSGLFGLLPAASKGGDTGGTLATSLPSLARDAYGPLPVLAHPLLMPHRISVAGAATRTSCKSVIYIGDSTSEGQDSPTYIQDPRLRQPAQLKAVGVRTVYIEISGARSIVEIFNGEPNAATVARSHISTGFKGCWMLAMGTNDSADFNVGSNVGLVARINKMMSIIGHQPVLWIDAISLLSSGPYAESGMQNWNQDLLAACDRYPNMRIFDWGSHAKPSYFIPDGIHYYSPGYVARANQFARALAEAFPARSPPNPSCLIS